jgi:hypothetical protein
MRSVTLVFKVERSDETAKIFTKSLKQLNGAIDLKHLSITIERPIGCFDIYPMEDMSSSLVNLEELELTGLTVDLNKLPRHLKTLKLCNCVLLCNIGGEDDVRMTLPPLECLIVTHECSLRVVDRHF